MTAPACPERVFKYRSWGKRNSVARKFATRLLLEDEIYFSNPSSFNDPFDCNARVTFTGTRRQAHKLAVQVAARGHEDDTPAMRAMRIEEIERQLLGNSLDQGLLTANELVAVCCFSERNDCPLMWGHYADRHTGICVEITGLRLQQVTYNDALAVVDMKTLLPRQGRVNMGCVLNKHPAWSYEKEWRIGRKGAGAMLLTEPARITGVITGMRMPDHERRHIKRLLKEAGRDIPVLKAQRIHNEYGIRFEPVE